MLNVAGRLCGKSAEVERLVGSLRVDSAPIRNTLGWTPPFSVADGLRQTGRWFASTGTVDAC